MAFNPNKFPTVEVNKNSIDNTVIDYKFKREGNMEFKLGETDVKFKYSSPDFKYLLKIIFNNTDFSPDISKMDILRNLRKIDDLTMENSSGKYSARDILGKDWSVLFWANKPSEHKSGSSISIDDKNIFLGINPLTPKGMLTLGHEIGHFEVVQSLSEQERSMRETTRIRFNFRHINSEVGEDVIKDERNAWARALSHLRHFSKDLEIENSDIEKLVHHDCLQSYKDVIEEFKSVA